MAQPSALQFSPSRPLTLVTYESNPSGGTAGRRDGEPDADREPVVWRHLVDRQRLQSTPRPRQRTPHNSPST